MLFNRFFQPDIDLETLTVVDRVQLSTSADTLLAMRWIAILRGQTPSRWPPRAASTATTRSRCSLPGRCDPRREQHPVAKADGDFPGCSRISSTGW